MMRRLRKFAQPSNGAPSQGIDEHLATALLLAELARADAGVGDSEQEAIGKLLANRFELEPAEAQALLDKALAHDEHAVSLYHYVQSLNDKLDYDGRREIIEMLWEVAYADGHLDRYEEHELRKIAGLLYVSDGDFIRAKLRVAG